MVFRTILSKIWIWLIAAAGVAISALVVIVRILSKQNSRLRARVETAEARVNHARVVAQEDINIIQDEQIREIEIINDLNDGRTSYDPNRLFDKNNNR